MAKYNVTHTCGHTATHQLVGPHTERDRKIAYYETQLCADCWQVEQDAKAKEIAEASANQGLPALQGSPKQITWAETIRAKILAEIDAVLGKVNPAHKALLDVTLAHLRSQDQAKYWIDNRGYSGPSLLDATGRKIQASQSAIN